MFRQNTRNNILKDFEFKVSLFYNINDCRRV